MAVIDNRPLADRLRPPPEEPGPTKRELRHLRRALQAYAMNLAAALVVVGVTFWSSLGMLKWVWYRHQMRLLPLVTIHLVLSLALVPLTLTILRRGGESRGRLVAMGAATYFGSSYLLGIFVPIRVYARGRRRLLREDAR